MTAYENLAPLAAETGCEKPHDNHTLFDERGAGVYLGGPDNPVSPRTMQRWRLEGVGPAFVKIGPRLVRYRRSELDAFLEGRVCQSTSQHYS